jgi:hypothetical protein
VRRSRLCGHPSRLLSSDSATLKPTLPPNVTTRRRTTSSVCIIRRRSVRRGTLPSPVPDVARPQIARAKEIKAQFIKKALHQAEEDRKASDIIADGVVIGVGLINREAKH